MGYRNYFKTIKKSTLSEIENLSYKELTDWVIKTDRTYCTKSCKYIDYDIFFNNGRDIFEFGKLYWGDVAEQIKLTGRKMFLNEETNVYFYDSDFYVVGKEGVLKAIEIYTNIIKLYYEDLLKDYVEKELPFDSEIGRYNITSDEKIKKHIAGKLRWLEYKTNLTDNKYCFTDSYLYEDSIFNLVSILKNIDWENETVVFYGC